MNRLRLSKGLIIITTILIAAFQCYWITRLYKQERESLRRETDVLFRDVVYKLQMKQFTNDSSGVTPGEPNNLFAFDVINEAKQMIKDSLLLKTVTKKDSSQKHLLITVHAQKRLLGDSNEHFNTDTFSIPDTPMSPEMLRNVFGNGSSKDSLPPNRVDSAYKVELLKNNINIGYKLKCISVKISDPKPDETYDGELKTNFIYTGLVQSYGYRAEFDAPFPYLLGKLKLPILISLFLVTFTIISFVFLYRNLRAQQRLASMKNEFISNITHELKTPIATVNVAIEALRNFNALQDPVKTREYLDISASELQRLSLLVDKVLRLSMFENDQVELKKEKFDLKVLTEEILSVMQLQVDKQKAIVTIKAEGDNFIIEADRMHITSVLYNLVDNALKYKRENPEIEIILISRSMHVELKVKDNGMGIPAEYRLRIFEKLFRVPTDNVHNIKGYGLGLSYVKYILHRHMGFIEVESELGKGSVFTAHIPYKEMNEIWFDDKRRIFKKSFALSRKKHL